ncbi:MAG: flagellar basal-body rod protein FlgF [Calditrichia bacterium]
MIKGLHIAKAGMLPQQRRLEVNANNLANMNTIGYKKDKVYFRNLINEKLSEETDNDQAAANTGAVVTDFTRGSFKETGNPFDLAIDGEGFFVINTPKGEFYTRNGNFSLNPEGRLITADGYSVMGNSGEIQINGTDIRITDNGTIMVDGQNVDALRIVKFEDPTQIIKMGSSYFSQAEGADVIDMDASEIKIRTGFLEGSNVSGMEEMVSMIELYHQFEMGQKVIASQNQTLEKLINDASRVG